MRATLRTESPTLAFGCWVGGREGHNELEHQPHHQPVKTLALALELIKNAKSDAHPPGSAMSLSISRATSQCRAQAVIMPDRAPYMSSGEKEPVARCSVQLSSAYVQAAISGMYRSGAFTSSLPGAAAKATSG